VKALAVSLLWRSSALTVIRSQNNMYRFRSSSGHAPTIAYSQVITSHMRPPRPTSDEQEKFGRHIDIMMRQHWSVPSERRTYPLARYTQLPEISPEMRDRLFFLGIVQDQFNGNALASKPIADHWLDLSQVETNPYFGLLGIWGDRIKQRLGCWEIDLHAHSVMKSPILEHDGITTALLGAIGSMCITNPPVRCIGIYRDGIIAKDGDTRKKGLLARICDNEGVKISEFLETLHQVAPILLETWLSRAQKLVDEVKHSHWIDDIWNVSGFPRFFIHLDHTDMPMHDIDFGAPGAPSRGSPSSSNSKTGSAGPRLPCFASAYLLVEPTRRERESEWLPEELSEPMKSTSGRAEINWER
jgi:hypothetical protein